MRAGYVLIVHSREMTRQYSLEKLRFIHIAITRGVMHKRIEWKSRIIYVVFETKRRRLKVIHIQSDFKLNAYSNIILIFAWIVYERVAKNELCSFSQTIAINRTSFVGMEDFVEYNCTYSKISSYIQINP